MMNSPDKVSTLDLLNVRHIKVNRLVMVKAGVYNTQYHRPYEMYVDNSVQDSLHECYRSSTVQSGFNTKVTNVDLNNVVPNLVMPSATPGQAVSIPNGWQTPRFRFMLEVEVESNATLVYFIQGYSDFIDTSHTGLIDPNMLMYINSITTVSRHYNVMGAPTDVVISSDNLIYNEGDPIDGFNGWDDNTLWNNTNHQSNDAYTTRPVDILSGIEKSYVMNYAAEDLNLDDSAFIDTRAKVTGLPISSARSNNSGSTFTSDIINASITSKNLVGLTSSAEDTLAKAKSIAGETVLSRNPIIRILAMGESQLVVKEFKFGDLVNLDDTVNERVNVIDSSYGNVVELNAVEYTDTWDKSNMESVAATVVSSNVSYLMSKYLIGKIDFSITNKTLDGSYATFIGAHKSFINNNGIKNIEAFKQAVEIELMPVITNNNVLQIELNVKADLYRDVWVSIAINGGITTEFASPTFCDSLASPIIATNQNSYNGLVSDFETIINQFE